MYQVTRRQKGQCLFNCAGEEVVTVTKPGEQPVKVCRRHLWEILAGDRKKPRAENTPA